MNVTLTPQLQAYIEQQVTDGRFRDADHAINDAVMLLEQKTRVAAQVEGAATNFAVLGSLDNQDISAMVILVLMEAAKSAQEDVRAIMAGVKAINATKAALRETIGKVRKDVAENVGRCGADAPVRFSDRGLGGEDAYHRLELAWPDVDSHTGVRFVPTDMHPGRIADARVLDVILGELTTRLDSLSEMGEMDSLRLQMAMDRRSKMMTTLSNIMKKASETAGSIVGNLK